MPDRRFAERVWYGTTAGHRVLRTALLPLAALFRATSGLRNALYDAGLLRARATAIPAISVGNLTVGGTGKTPVAAWIAAALAREGGRPAIVLRGYGADEPLVHAVLNPDIPVEVAPDRTRGVAAAAAKGADVAVLDDAFQHRGVARVADIVLISADAFENVQRPLPAGPWREPLRGLRRATAAIVTRKAAGPDDVARVRTAVAVAAPSLPIGVARLEPSSLRSLRTGAEQPLRFLSGRRVLVIAAIGDPRAFVAQLVALGANCTARAFGDHHTFIPTEIEDLSAESAGFDLTVCTLKDAVKLEPFWPRAAVPVWYVSQRIIFEEGEDMIRRLLAAARGRVTPTDFTGTQSASR